MARPSAKRGHAATRVFGQLVSADSVVSGLFTQVVLPRSPATFSVSLENLAGSKKATIDQPSLSTYRDALANVLSSEITGSTPANIYSEIEEVHSDSQVNMALGVQASWALGLASLKSSFNFGSTSVRSRYVVRYTQAYYTVDLDAPESPSALLGSDVTLADVQAKMDAEHPPAYVSSVTYRRMIVFTFESQYSATESRRGARLRVLRWRRRQGRRLRHLQGHHLEQQDQIAYKLGYLKDNSPARVSFTTDYTVKDCVRVAQKIKVTLQSITVESAAGDLDNNLELYGLATAAGTTATTLFTKDRSNHVTIEEGKSFGSATSPIAEGVIEVKPQPGESIRLRANLTDYDPTLGDDASGDETVLVPYETGWRKTVSVVLTGSSSRVRVNYQLAPI